MVSEGKDIREVPEWALYSDEEAVPQDSAELYIAVDQIARKLRVSEDLRKIAERVREAFYVEAIPREKLEILYRLYKGILNQSESGSFYILFGKESFGILQEFEQLEGLKTSFYLRCIERYIGQCEMQKALFFTRALQGEIQGVAWFESEIQR